MFCLRYLVFQRIHVKIYKLKETKFVFYPLTSLFLSFCFLMHIFIFYFWGVKSFNFALWPHLCKTLAMCIKRCTLKCRAFHSFQKKNRCVGGKIQGKNRKRKKEKDRVEVKEPRRKMKTKRGKVYKIKMIEREKSMNWWWQRSWTLKSRI